MFGQSTAIGEPDAELSGQSFSQCQTTRTPLRGTVALKMGARVSATGGSAVGSSQS